MPWAHVFNVFLGPNHLLGIVIGCGIIIGYSVFGRMRSVVATDILPFWVLVITIPLCLNLGISYVGDPQALVASPLATHLSFPGPLGLLSIIILFFLGEVLVPPHVQHLPITKDTQSTRKEILISGLLSIFFITAASIGLTALHLDAGLRPSMTLPYVIHTILPSGLKGIAIAAIVAVIMSSADSYLNASAIALVQDIISEKKLSPLSKG